MPNHKANSLGDVSGRLRRLAADRAHARRLARLAQPDTTAPAEAADPGLVRSTVEATIRPIGSTGYRRLGWAPGEPHLLRTDPGVDPTPDRRRTRRSLLYFAQHTDAHICDVQAPARLEGGETFGWVNAGADGGFRPQEACGTRVLDRMVAATNELIESPETGAEMAWCIQTGDNTDNRTRAELAWFVGVLEGRTTVPNTGAPGRYEGVQNSRWRGSWNPDDPSRDIYGLMGFPRLVGLLDATVAAFEPVGLDVGWLTVFGNHDSIFSGTFGPARGLRIDRLGPMLGPTTAKPSSTIGLVRAILHASVLGADTDRWQAWAQRCGIGIRHVVADPEARAPLSLTEYLAEMLDPDSVAGPVGHGFTVENLREATSWWSRPEGDQVQVIGLDTCNHTNGDGGSIGPRQLAWLEGELAAQHSRWRDVDGRWVDGDGPDRLIVITSHHNSWTMDNHHDDLADPGARTEGAALVALLKRFPNVILWVNGHSHEHQIIRHRASEPGSGFWEVDTASLIDFSQQGRTFELLDNDDGTVSILTTVFDHASPPTAPRHQRASWTSTELASLSRELAANDRRWIDPIALLGEPADRNVEMVLRAPFVLRGLSPR